MIINHSSSLMGFFRVTFIYLQSIRKNRYQIWCIYFCNCLSSLTHNMSYLFQSTIFFYFTFSNKAKYKIKDSTYYWFLYLYHYYKKQRNEMTNTEAYNRTFLLLMSGLPFYTTKRQKCWCYNWLHLVSVLESLIQFA